MVINKVYIFQEVTYITMKQIDEHKLIDNRKEERCVKFSKQ